MADDYRGYMNKGEKQYKGKDYKNAAEQYHQAEVLKPDDPLPGFNSGAALYRAEDIEKAAEKFSQSAGVATGAFKSDAYYNLGNSLYQKQDYQGALKAYRNSLINEPTRQDAKFNYELAEIKQQEQQQQQQQQQQDQNKDDKQDKQDQKQKQDQNQDQKDKQDQKQQQQKNDEKKNEQDQKQQQQNQQQQQEQQQQPKKGEMTQQEAKDLLEAFKEDEKQIQKELKKFQIKPGSRRDW